MSSNHVSLARISERSSIFLITDVRASELSEEDIDRAFPPTPPRRVNCRPCYHCGERISIDQRFIRCGHAMHQHCIATGGLDNGCPECREQLRGFESQPVQNCEICHFQKEMILLPCSHTICEQCITDGALVNGCPYCRRRISTYGEWRAPAPLEATAAWWSNFSPRDETENNTIQLLFSELFHINSDLFIFFGQELATLRRYLLRRYLHGEVFDEWIQQLHDSDVSERENFRQRIESITNIRILPHIPRKDDSQDADVVRYLSSFMNLEPDSDDRMTYLRLFASYAAGSGFNPCFWLPHHRMYLRATSPRQRRLVHLHMVRYIREYHDRSDMVDLSFELVPLIASDEEIDRLLSELYHIHPELWCLFEPELQRLEEIELDSTFDLNGWLDDLRRYPTIEERNEPSQLYSFFRYLDTQGQAQQFRDNQTFYLGVYNALGHELDDDTVNVRLQDANRTLQGGNQFHPNFWLPHRRMFQRATSDADRCRVISHMISYVKMYHGGNQLMSALQRSYEQQYGTVSRGGRENNLTASYPREEWVSDETEIAGYREYGSGYQVLLKTHAPRGGFFDYELVPAHRCGGLAAIMSYTRRMEEQGMAPFHFEEASIDRLRSKSKDQIRIAGRCVHHRKQRRARGTVLQQYLMLTFANEEGVYWYSKGIVEHYHNRVWVENSLLPGLYDASGLTPPEDIRQLNYQPQTSYTEETIQKISDLKARTVSIDSILRGFFLRP
ncbi:hypothetical protein I7I51_01984 [Histoplasma capsulatum]|uniref:RING-type domain-containing protein n=1 Tax=Ajellomyces capsulatus TaxID=5037 RepID=A0A8A1MG53_AJECA|nr:hypothetical protein I7I51_01984 [Histoplasma capsulatum]